MKIQNQLRGAGLDGRAVQQVLLAVSVSSPASKSDIDTTTVETIFIHDRLYVENIYY